jgi:hypothetical protein
MNISDALELLKEHVQKHSKEKYYRSDINADGLLLRKDFTIGSAVKYLVRYMAKEGEKRAQLDDLLKACHFILFEVQNRLQQQLSVHYQAEAFPVNDLRAALRLLGFVLESANSTQGLKAHITLHQEKFTLVVYENNTWRFFNERQEAVLFGNNFNNSAVQQIKERITFN